MGCHSSMFWGWHWALGFGGQVELNGTALKETGTTASLPTSVQVGRMCLCLQKLTGVSDSSFSSCPGEVSEKFKVTLACCLDLFHL